MGSEEATLELVQGDIFVLFTREDLEVFQEVRRELAAEDPS